MLELFKLNLYTAAHGQCAYPYVPACVHKLRVDCLSNKTGQETNLGRYKLGRGNHRLTSRLLLFIAAVAAAGAHGCSEAGKG